MEQEDGALPERLWVQELLERPSQEQGQDLQQLQEFEAEQEHEAKRAFAWRKAPSMTRDVSQSSRRTTTQMEFIKQGKLEVHQKQGAKLPSVAILFPDAGNQYVGMLAARMDMPIVKEYVELASDCFKFDVGKMMLEGNPAEMSSLYYSQMLTYVANSVAWEVLKKEHAHVLKDPYCVAGYSLGEINALVAAGIMSFDQGLIVVQARAEAMKRWVQDEEMPEMRAVGIYGLEGQELEKRCISAINQDRRRGTMDPQVSISQQWGYLGFVCSGCRSTVEILTLLVETKANVLVFPSEDVSFALHTPMATQVAAEIEEVFMDIPLEPPDCEVYFNAGLRVSKGADPEQFFAAVVSQLTTPVDWMNIIHLCIQRGVREFFEAGPGKSLKDFMIFNTFADVGCSIEPYEVTMNIPV